MRIALNRVLAVIVAAMMMVGLSTVQSPVARADGNLALGKEVTASGQETSWWGPEKLVDGDAGPADATSSDVHRAQTASRWSANNSDHVWAAVDLAAMVKPSLVRVRWGNNFSTNYSLLGSTDGKQWNPLVTKGVGAAGQWREHEIAGPSAVRYVKLESFAKSQKWPLSVWALEVHGVVVGEVEAPFRTAVTPRPAQQSAGEHGDFQLAPDTAFVAEGPAVAVAESVAKTLRTATGFELPIKNHGQGVRFGVRGQSDHGSEGYSLTSGSEGVTIEAKTLAGLRYGGQTLLQLLGPWAHSAEPVVQGWVVPGVSIVDEPRYAWRGFMLDVARNFFTVDEVKQLIDQMAQYKLNVLHMHLTDDQGWRIAISNAGKVASDPIDYTDLTRVSGATAMAPTRWTDGEGTSGFYTASDFREILRYAHDNGVSVVPEVDVPGHTNAILHAVPQLNSAGSLPKPNAGESVVPAQRTGDVGNSALDANLELTYVFIKHVIGQMLSEYPSEVHGETFFHIGGDETHKMNEDNPNNYRTFMRKTTDMVQGLGATGIVWNEAVESAAGSLADGLVVQPWSSMNGVADYVNNHNGRVIMSLASVAYLPQIPGDVLGPNWACHGPCGLRQFYDWDPTARSGVAEDKVLGVEAPIWGEHLRSWKAAEYLIYPRLAATAEVGWTPQRERSFADFSSRVGSLGNSLTVQDRNFYPEDGTWTPDAKALARGPLDEGQTVGDVAVASIPEVKLADVRATMSWDRGDPGSNDQSDGDGLGAAVEVTAERDFKPGHGQKFDDRSAASLFRFAIPAALPAGRHVGTLKIGYPGGSLSVPVEVDVETPSTPEPSASPSVPQPSVSPSEPQPSASSPVPAPSVSSSTPATPSPSTVTPSVAPDAPMTNGASAAPALPDGGSSQGLQAQHPLLPKTGC